MTFAGRVALVTGGTSGIGAATAHALTCRGARVFVAARSAPPIGALDPADSMFIACDITDDVAVQSLVEDVRARAGRLDFAVNAAGYEGPMAPLHTYPVDDCRQVLSVNVIGTFLSLKYELEAMREQGNGAIVNLASIAGVKGIPNASAYAASKHAVIGLTKTAALEVADVPIRVNAVCPSLVDTAMADRLSEKTGVSRAAFAEANPMGRIASADEIADTICWLLSKEASFVNGQALGVDGGLSVV